MAIWTRHGVRMRQLPVAREAAMIEPDVVLEWSAEPDRLGGASVPDDARRLEDAMVEQVRPRLDGAGRDLVLQALGELGGDARVDELVALIGQPIADDTADRVVALLGLPGRSPPSRSVTWIRPPCREPG